MRYVIPLFIIILLFSSCSDNSKTNSSSLNVFRAIEEGLQQSIIITSGSNKLIYYSFEDKLADPESSKYALVWQPKVAAVKSLSDNIVTYIRKLKEELKDEAGFSNPLDRKSFKKDNISTVNHFFNEHDKGKELFYYLLNYRKNMLAVDTQLNNELKNNIGIFERGFDLTRNDTTAFTKSFFNDIPVIAACAMLSKIENDIMSIENTFILFYHGQISDHPARGHEIVMPVVMQSKTSVKSGEEIEITAGIAMFSNRAGPVITFGGKPVSTDFGGVAHYTLKAAASTGKHTVPIKIEFFKPDGTKEYLTKNITYTVEQ